VSGKDSQALGQVGFGLAARAFYCAMRAWLALVATRLI